MNEEEAKTNRKATRFAVLAVPLAMVAMLYSIWSHIDLALVNVQAPASFSRRAEPMTVNVCGTLSSLVRRLEYQLNGGHWVGVKGGPPRVLDGHFIIELHSELLRPGRNELRIRAYAYGRHRAEVKSVPINYDPSPVKLPLVADWSSGEVESYDGEWESFMANGERRVRPSPGMEGYDRIVLVTGAFPGGRRIETDVIFRRATNEARHGFGVLTLWGGHIDEPGVGPRRGWLFGLVWYSSRYNGVANDFSRKEGAGAVCSLTSAKGVSIAPGQRFNIVVETWPEIDADGLHRFRQRMKWWSAGKPAPEYWVELSDTARVLPDQEYSVALLASRCQVDFGPVSVTPLQRPAQTGQTD